MFFAATACTQDELADDTRLPEGQYPLQIAAVTLSVEGGEAQPWGAPQTRVSETEDGTGSKWDGDEETDVQIEGSTETATYIVQAGGTVTSNAPLYWSDRDNHTVNAWYPATPLDLSDQTNGLAYLLHGKGWGNYEKPVELIFTHSLAKVRVTPSKDIGDGEVTSLQLYTYTTCTHTQGKINTEDAQKGWIKMKKCEYNGVTCWEANVVPDYEITKLMANDNGKERELSAPINPKAGSFYNITLNKDKGYTVSEDGKTYTVYTADGLLAWNKAVQNDLTLNCTLTADITLTGEWTPIGGRDSPYMGTFDGGDHTITGVIVNTYNYAGLIGNIGDGGVMKNLKMEKVQITSQGLYIGAGGIAGYNYGTIENCSVSGTVESSTALAGGITGMNYGTITGCTASGHVSAGFATGGIVGNFVEGKITDCHSYATVEGSNSVGGVAGYMNSNATLAACSSTESVTATGTSDADAGGVVGNISAGATVTACYATGSVSAEQGSNVGGVVGFSDGIITACYHATGKVSGFARVGGVLGLNHTGSVASGTVTACYWSDYDGSGIGEDETNTGETTQVTDGNWTDAVTQMNAALQSVDSEWLYELTGKLPTLTKQ